MRMLKVARKTEFHAAVKDTETTYAETCLPFAFVHTESWFMQVINSWSKLQIPFYQNILFIAELF